MGIFSKGLTFLLKDFACWTSTHGVPHIGGSNNMWLRLFWVVVVIGCVIGFLVQLQNLIHKYLSYQVNTETKLQFEERPFPVVTICHLNPWKKNETVGESDFMTAMAAAYEAQTANANFGFSATLNGARQQRAARLTTLANAHLFDLSDESVDNGTVRYPDPGYSYSDLVVSCTYNAATCNETFFASYKDPNYGRCVQFNPTGYWNSSRAGPLYGLRMIIRTNQAEYLPWTESAGVVVSIHNKTDLPFPDVVGYYAPVGTSAGFGVKYVTTSRQPHPYGDCSEKTEVTLNNYKGVYQVEACYRSCTQDQIIKQCSCYHPGLPYAQGDAHPSCYVDGVNATAFLPTSNNLDCIDKVMFASGGSTFDVLKDCDCPQPCKVQTYATTISTARWPSAGYIPNECNDKLQPAEPWPWMNNQLGRNKTLCLAWYRKNTLLIEAYYERMNYQMLNESPAYTLVSCISEIAGQVGLFLGMSIISVFEFFTLLLLVFYYVSSHRSRRLELEQIDAYIKNAEQETKEMEKKEEEKEARKRAEKLRKEADLYDDDHHDSALPPKVTDAE